MPLTMIESIVERHVIGREGSAPPAPGDLVTLRPSVLMTHDNSSAIRTRFERLGARSVVHPDRAVIVLDHDIQNRTEANLAKYAAIEGFARLHGMDFHPAGSGIGHQVLVETLRVLPGELAVAADSHANMYGALGALGAPITRSDAAGVWATGLFWWEVPRVVRVVLERRLRGASTGKDVALVLCALHPDDALGAAVEFDGPGVAALTMDDRLTIANLTTEWGAAACVFPVDETTITWIEARRAALGEPGRVRVGDSDVARWASDPPRADPGATYAATIRLDLAAVAPHVSGPDRLDRAAPLSEFAREPVRIDKAYLVSCANGRLSDLEAAAEVLRGRRVATGVALYVAAASEDVQEQAEASGAWQVLLEAGAVPLPSGCGPCIGLGAGLLEAGETGISSSNRNFKGRMGSPDARCFLASPAVVAASAAAGFVTGPPTDVTRPPARRLELHSRDDRCVARRGASADPALGRIVGRVILALRDGIDTDALCPKELVYQDAISIEALAAGVFATIQPGFAAHLRDGDILVAGARFGVGSSREQAALALRAAGVRAVVAASLSPVFRRNALNNGLVAIEAPEYVASARARHPEGSGAITVTTDTSSIDLDRSIIESGSVTVAFEPLAPVARELLAAGGLDGYLRARIPRTD